LKLKKLLNDIKIKANPRIKDLEITSVAVNSKGVKKGSLFIAIKGSRFDGHGFIGEAFKRGALAAIAEEAETLKMAPDKLKNIVRVKDTRKALSVAAKNFYHSPSEKLKVIGITGTNGKTTISLLIESIFNAARIPCGVMGTIENKIGNRRIPAERTTPDALGVNVLLDQMLKNGLKASAMEVSSHGLDQKRVDDISFDAAIFTNLTHEHLDYHGDLSRYFKSKTKIFTRLKKEGVAILNVDDRRVASCAKNMTEHKYITYGLKKTAYVSADIRRIDLDGSAFTVKLRGKGAFLINTRLIGLHNVSNILAAVAAGVTQGIDLRDIKNGIERVNSIKGRVEPVCTEEGFKVFVDYAHTHNALENVLTFLSTIKRNRIITVFGCGGDRDRSKRPLMGRVAQKLSDFVIVTSDNPRSEDPGKIARDIERGMKKQKYVVVKDRKKAIETALKIACPGDIVLIAGKGHENVQIIGKREIPFNDKKVAEQAINEIKAKKSKMPIEHVLKSPGSISIDTRTIKKGDTFLAIQGERFDGHCFVKEAFKKGAKLAIVSKIPQLPTAYKSRLICVKNTVKTLGDIARLRRLEFNTPVVAITGSNGKTTAKDLAAHVLGSGYNVLKNETSKNNLIGLPLTLCKLQKKHGVAVLEMGMNHFGEIRKLSEIAKPNIGVVTNIGPSHLEFLGTLRNVYKAKAELFECLTKKDTVVLNADDSYLRNPKNVKAKKVYFGIEKKCFFQAKNLIHEKNRWTFSLGKEKGFELTLLGKHNIYNALIAIAVARQFGIEFSTIKKRIKTFRPSCPMRLQSKRVRGVEILDDSYNSNPLSMECAIDTLAGHVTRGKRIVVTGDMLELGKNAKSMHEEVGGLIARGPFDTLITMGRLSRFTRNRARDRGMQSLYHAASHRGAASLLKKITRPGDIVLVKGSRGMQMEKVIEEFKSLPAGK